jgi:hypothetical protein
MSRPTASLALFALLDVDPNRLSCVLCDKAAALSLAENAFQAGQHLARHRPRALTQEIVAKGLDRWCRQAGELLVPDPRRLDMQVDVVAVLSQRRPLKAFKLAFLDPQLGRLGHRDAHVLGRVHPARYLALRCHEPGLCLTLAGEGLDVALAGLIEIVGDPIRAVQNGNRTSAWPKSASAPG